MPEHSDFFPQVMQRYTDHPALTGIDKAFIAELLCAFEEKPFCPSSFDPFPVDMIVDYIQRTHEYYLRKKLPEIEQSIVLLSELYTSHHPILAALQNFFQRYCKDLNAHIRAEETQLLPFIVLLQRASATPDALSEYILARQQYSISRFLADHHDTEDELKDIRHTIGLYEPPATNESLYRILLTQLQTFEQDLCVHAHIEDEVLIPKSLQLETALNDRLGRTAGAN